MVVNGGKVTAHTKSLGIVSGYHREDQMTQPVPQKKSLKTGVAIACVLGGLLAPCILSAVIQGVFGSRGNGSRMRARERPWYPLRDLIPAEDRVELDKDWNELLDSVDDMEKDLNKGL